MIRSRPGPRAPHVLALVALGFGSIAALPAPDPVKIAALALALACLIAGGPLAALFATCACLPIWMQALDVRGGTWGPLELALLACGFVSAIYLAREVVRGRSLCALVDWLPPRDILVAALALCLVAAGSLLWLVDVDLRADSVRALRRVIVEPLLIIPVATFAVRRGTARGVAPWIAVPAMLVSVLALGQLATDRSTVDIGGISRPVGPFSHPNNLAFYVERAIWFVPVAALIWTRDRRVVGCCVGLVLLGCVATLSRGSALALACGLLVFGWSTVRARKRAAVLAALAIAGLVFAFRLVAESGDSVASRFDIWRSSVEMLRDHAFTGVGLDQFLGQYGTRYVRPEGWAERYTSHPHNILLDFWLSLGAGGLMVLWLLGEALWTRLRTTLRGPDWTVERAATALLAAGVAHGLVDNSFFLPDLATWTWLGLVLASYLVADK